MSFFSSIAKKFDDLDLGGGTKNRDGGYGGTYGPSTFLALQPHSLNLCLFPRPIDRPPQPQHASRDYGYSNNGPPQGGYSGGSYQSPPPPQQHYQSPPPPQQHYQSPPPPSSSSGPVYSPPPGKPPIPQGWEPQYDNQHQRWYYYEHASGRSQWEAPGYQHQGSGDTRGYETSGGGGGGGYHGGGVPYGGGYNQHGSSGGQGYEHDRGDNNNNPYGQSAKKKSSSSGMLLAGTGGLAVGAIGGAMLANALG